MGDAPGTCQWWSAMLVKLQAFIAQFDLFHSGCFPKKCPKVLQQLLSYKNSGRLLLCSHTEILITFFNQG